MIYTNLYTVVVMWEKIFDHVAISVCRTANTVVRNKEYNKNEEMGKRKGRFLYFKHPH